MVRSPLPPSPEPPVPATPPKLLERKSKQLLVMPMTSHQGHGPIQSTKLLYKPMDNGDSWSSIIGEPPVAPLTATTTDKI